MNTRNESIENYGLNLASGPKENTSGIKALVIGTMVAWFAIIFYLATQKVFVAAPGSPPLPLLLGFAIPLAAFFAAYFAWGTFREMVLGADLRFLTAVQAWRWAGSHFLFLYAQGVLPGLFAFSAGLGDMAVGVTAPWIVLGLVRNSSFVSSRRFVIWNLLGILDLVTALSLGALFSGILPGLTSGGVTTAAMGRLPMVLVPTYFVPCFIMLHIAALFQTRRAAHTAEVCG